VTVALARTAGNRATGRWLAGTRRLARSPSRVDPRPLQLEVDQQREVYMATEYAVIPRADGGTNLEAVYWASFTVEGDAMIISVRTRLADGTRSPTLRFDDQFDKAMAWFAGQGVDVRAIDTEWSYMTPTEKSSNLSEYERLLATGLSREAAAEGTPSGRLLTTKGWRLAEIGPMRYEVHEHLSPDAVEPAERIPYPTQRARWVRPTGPATGTPGAGTGTPPAGGGPLRGATSASAARPAAAGALNARGVAQADALGLALDTLNVELNRINDAEQKRRTGEAIHALRARVEKLQRERPDCGVLLIVVKRQLPVDPHSAIKPGPRFAGVELGVGRDEWEADRNREDSSIPPPREGETDTEAERIWFPAPHPADPQVPPPPWPSVALATFGSKAPTLTEVWWANLPSGFDDRGTQPLDVPPGVEPRFHVLAPPASMKAEIPDFRGRWVEENPIARGTSDGLPVARLDVYVPFDRDVAVAIYPADAATARLFATVAPTRHWQLLRGVRNFDLVRWVTPDQIALLGD
jgi:hypothetical protein